MHISYIGLGKMGRGMVERMLSAGHTVNVYDQNDNAHAQVSAFGASVTASIADLMTHTPTPRIVWLMVPNDVVESVLVELAPHLVPGDTIIEGGNSPYKETMRRAQDHEMRGVHFLDVGVSGGPGGAKHGACIMVGGSREVFDAYESLFKDLSIEHGYRYMGKSGAGHFVKMVHNGIEYGMMQALAEGFDILKKSEFNLSLTTIANLYNHGSVIESRLVGWLRDGFETYGEDLAEITGTAHASGEGLWTVQAAQEMGIPTVVIEDSLRARELSQKKPSYQGQLISVMRNMFGGHNATK